MSSRTLQHGEVERARQAHFRDSSSTISDAGRAPEDPTGKRHPYLLSLDSELENLFPGVRPSAPAFFKERGIGWWRSAVSKDRSAKDGGGLVPTRNMASSQVACVNLLSPLIDRPAALTELLRAIDPDVEEVVPIHHQGRAPTFIEFEWVGCCQTLEEDKWSRGANATSIDALLLGKIPGGIRAFLLEWKYVEAGGDEDKASGTKGAKRLGTYSERYERSRLFRPQLKQVLVAPIYQLVRSILLGHRMAEQRELGVSDARTVVVCPAGNDAYLTLAPSHARWLGDATTLEVAMKKHVLRKPDVFAVTSQARLVEAVRRTGGALPDGWSDYMNVRYGW
jgi:hypothetical protein